MNPNKILLGAGVFLITLFVLAGVYRLVDDDANASRQLYSDDYISCFEDDRYVQAITENLKQDGVLDSQDNEKLSKLKAEYYIKCINDIRRNK